MRWRGIVAHLVATCNGQLAAGRQARAVNLTVIVDWWKLLERGSRARP